MIRRTLALTAREYDALIRAMAEYEAAHDNDDDPLTRQDLAAFDRFITKWNLAGRPRKRSTTKQPG